MADGGGSIEQFDIQQIAAALGISKRGAELRANKAGWAFTVATVRGGQRRLFAISTLPRDVQAALLLAKGKDKPESPASAPAPSDSQISAAWARYEAAPQHLKDIAARRLRALQAVDALVQEGNSAVAARQAVAAELQRENVRGASVASLYRWASDVAKVAKQHRLAVLLPEYTGRTTTKEIPAEAWDLFKADYLRVEAPSATSCYDRLGRVAKVRGWELPHLRTFMRRIDNELPRAVLVLARQGTEALERIYPAQERDRTVFHALEGVNADGHKFDVFVRWPDGRIARPILVGIQDLYSGKILGYRLAETESADLVRMAFRDVIARYGIPRKAWLDNGRAFASKMITGGVANRFRFKVKQEDPVGILTSMGMDIHWTTPYHGQAKPIERAWRDLCDRVSKHPAFAGAYTGNKPDAKPENYGSKAVPLDTFVKELVQEITAHNARPGRRTRVCDGQYSFDQAFNHSYAQSTIQRASEAQLREMLMAAEVVTASAQDGAVRLAGNRYWSQALAAYAGQKVMLRFDPDALHDAVQVYTLANVYLGQADCIQAVGFADTQAARDHSRAKGVFKRAAKQQLEAERRMSVAALVNQLPEVAPEQLPETGVIAPLFGKARPKPEPAAEPLARTGTDDARTASLSDFLARAQAQQNADIGWRPKEEDEL